MCIPTVVAKAVGAALGPALTQLPVQYGPACPLLAALQVFCFMFKWFPGLDPHDVAN